MYSGSSSAGWSTHTKTQKHHIFYLDEFTFRFNRRRSRSQGQALRPAGPSHPWPSIWSPTTARSIQTNRRCAHIIFWGYLSQPDTQKLFRILACREQCMHTALRKATARRVAMARGKTGSSFAGNHACHGKATIAMVLGRSALNVTKIGFASLTCSREDCGSDWTRTRGLPRDRPAF